MTVIRIGRVASKGKVHLAVDGRLADGWTGRHITHDADLAKVDPSRLCHRCFRRSRVEQALQAATAAPVNRYNPAAVELLAAALEAVKGPAERAADADLCARIAATIEAANVVQELPRQARPRTWAVLRDEFAETHPPTAVRSLRRTS